MRQFFLITTALVLTIAASLIDTLQAGRWFWLPVCWILVVAFSFGLSGYRALGIGSAILGGALRASTSVWWWGLYPLSFLIGLAVAWVFVQRIVAERSTASLVAALAVGSLSAVLTQWAIVTLVHIFQPAALIAPASSWWTNAIAQTLTQPLLVWLAWRLRGGGQFATVTSLAHPFS